MNVLERAMLGVFPGVVRRRLEHRANALRMDAAIQRFERKQLKRGYEGAARGRRTQGWVGAGGSANAEARPALTTLRDRCRDLVRNNSHAATAVRVIASQMVGSGIRPVAVHESDAVMRRAQALFEEWGETTACDPEGRQTFYGMQHQAARSMVEGGEMLLRRRPRRAADKVPGIPLQLQPLEGDFLDTAQDGPVGGTSTNRRVQGVEFDAVGRRIAYHLFPEHPGDATSIGFAGQTSRAVPAANVVHLFRADRVGQVRGIAWGAPVVVRIHDYDKYEDNEALRLVVATSYAGFVQDIEPDVSFRPENAAQPLNSSGPNTNQLGQAIDELESGTVEFLPNGKQITFSRPPQNEGFPAYSQVQLRAIAKGYGVTYEALTGDLKSTSFSSGRLGFLDFHRDIEVWRRHTLIPQFCQPTWRWFVETAAIAGFLPADVRARWTPPRRDMINPQAEMNAMVAGVRAGFFSLSEGIRMFGFDADTSMRELAKDLRLAQALGISVVTDARLNASTGGVPTTAAPDPEGDPSKLPDPEAEPPAEPAAEPADSDGDPGDDAAED